jgi:hypothetical protein
MRNDISMWQTVCNNGLFDIWDPTAPYDRLAMSRSDPAELMIQLVRIYEMDGQLDSRDVRSVSDRIDHLVGPQRTVTIKGPVVTDGEFHKIKALLVSSVSQYRPGAPSGPSTAQTRDDTAALELEDDYSAGNRKSRYSSYYERNPSLRRAAVRYHGTKCKVCGFDFEKAYGKRGAGFIEDHH